jgi:hypothetical protein
MTLPDRLAAELLNLVVHAGPPAETVALSDPSGLELAIDFNLVDRISCAFEEMRLDVPTLVNCDIERLKQWAQSLSSRVTYLLENLGPIEIDTQAGQVLIRSTPPRPTTGWHHVLRNPARIPDIRPVHPPPLRSHQRHRWPHPG